MRSSNLGERWSGKASKFQGGLQQSQSQRAEEFQFLSYLAAKLVQNLGYFIAKIHSYIWQTLLRLAHTNKPDFSTKKLLRSYPKSQKFLVIFWNNLVPSYMQGVKVMAKWNFEWEFFFEMWKFFKREFSLLLNRKWEFYVKL